MPDFATYLGSLVAALALGLALAGCGGTDSDSVGEGGAGRERDERRPASNEPSEMTVVLGERSGSSAEGQMAPRNPQRVPDVVGMEVPRAVRALREAGYGCAIEGIKAGGAAGPRRVAAQAPGPRAKGYEAQLVRLSVSTPFPEGETAAGCAR